MLRNFENVKGCCEFLGMLRNSRKRWKYEKMLRLLKKYLLCIIWNNKTQSLKVLVHFISIPRLVTKFYLCMRESFSCPVSQLLRVRSTPCTACTPQRGVYGNAAIPLSFLLNIRTSNTHTARSAMARCTAVLPFNFRSFAKAFIRRTFTTHTFYPTIFFNLYDGFWFWWLMAIQS